LIREIAWTIGLDRKSGDHINPELEGNLLSGAAEKDWRRYWEALETMGVAFLFFGWKKLHSIVSQIKEF
jgi:hypothetical protein